jgi:competence protein ComEC
MQREDPINSSNLPAFPAAVAQAAIPVPVPTRPSATQGLSIFYALGLGCVLGITVQLQQAELWQGSQYIGLGAAAAVLLAAMVWQGLSAKRSEPNRGSSANPPLWHTACQAFAQWLILFLLAGTLGFAWAGNLAKLQAARQLTADHEGSSVVLSGVVQGMVQRNALGQRFRFKLNQPPDGLPPLLMVSWADGSGQRPVLFDTSTLPPLPAEGHDVKPGDTWELPLRLKAVHGNHNPGGFDYELWMWEQGMGANASVVSGAKAVAKPLRLHRGWRHPVERVRQAIRDRIFKHLSPYGPASLQPDNLDSPDTNAPRNLSPAQVSARWAGVVAALVVGDQNAIARNDWDLFRVTGVAHLVSISGLHITMFAWLAAWVVAWCWRRRPSLCERLPVPMVAALGGLALATLYALLSGWGLPAQRTIGMLAVVVCLRLSGRQWPWLRTWLLVMLSIALLDPWALLSAGFWLSFVAVGVLFATGPSPARGRDQMQEAVDIASEGGPSWLWRVQQTLSHAVRLMREQWVITFALAPLTLLLFQQQSVCGLVANLVAGPWMTVVVTPLAMLGVAIPYAWDAAALALQGQMAVLGWLASWPLATINVAAAPLWLSVLGIAGAVLCVLPIAWPMRMAGSPFVLMVLLWQAPRPALGQYEVWFTDVGQGNAVLVRTLNHTLVYDTGPKYQTDADAGQRVVVPLLNSMAEDPDVLLVSHQDIDHSGGVTSLLTAYPRLQYISSTPPDHQSARTRVPTRCFSARSGGQRWAWDGVQFEILHPDKRDYDQAVPSNAMSCVLRISNGMHTVLLTGDLEADQEAVLLAEQPDKLRADVLLVPHHGSKTSSTGLFLDAVQPKMAIVQAGYKNRYGHPAPRILQRYAVRDIAVFDSPHCGAAFWNSQRPASIQCSRHTLARYWHHQLGQEVPETQVEEQATPQ